MTPTQLRTSADSLRDAATSFAALSSSSNAAIAAQNTVEASATAPVSSEVALQYATNQGLLAINAAITPRIRQELVSAHRSAAAAQVAAIGQLQPLYTAITNELIRLALASVSVDLRPSVNARLSPAYVAEMQARPSIVPVLTYADGVVSDSMLISGAELVATNIESMADEIERADAVMAGLEITA